tara:strand:+ start:3775 stop:4107 length:333 start_codon:yes stop_codon:yes gene_type:complete
MNECVICKKPDFNDNYLKIQNDSYLCNDCIKEKVGYSISNNTKTVDELIGIIEFAKEGNISPVLENILTIFGRILKKLIQGDDRPINLFEKECVTFNNKMCDIYDKDKET